jgi:archaellum component FlaC
MDKQDIYSEIEILINELETLVKSLATARELIAESSNNRASGNLSEIEIKLQAIAGKVSKIKSSI